MAASPLLRDRGARERRLAVIDAAVTAGTATAALQFERAQLLDALGMTDAARDGFIAVLTHDPDHAGALNDLGGLLNRTGFHTAARTAFARAVAMHPDEPTGHCNLASSFFDADDIVNARRHYDIALALDPGHVATNQCLAVLLLRLGEDVAARRHAALGFRDPSAWPYRGDRTALPVLVLYSALGGNIATDTYLDDRTFAKWTLVAEFTDPATPLPPHALVFNAIGDADRCGTALRAAQALVERTSAPVINRPRSVMATGRQANAGQLAGLPGVIVPDVATRSRRALIGDDAFTETGFDWPLIVRAPGFHTGKHCLLVADPSELAAAVATLPGSDVLLLRFIDVRRPDGLVRKYRVMIVGDSLLPLHLAISHDWKVHYFSADMADHPEHRLEEAAFLADMSGVLGTTAMTALRAIKDRLGLDYGGIDFAIDDVGRVVVFEANATMIVPDPPADDCWSYRREPVARIRAAVRTMLLEATA